MSSLVLICVSFVATLSRSQVIQGRATYYNIHGGGGHCSFPYNSQGFPGNNLAAANTAWYSASQACGECYEVKCTGKYNPTDTTCTCTNSSAIVQIWDECPAVTNSQWCGGDVPHLDLSTEAFATIAKPSCGVIKTSFTRVNCPFTGNIRLKTKDGINPWWFALFVLDVGGDGRITKVEIKSGSSGWKAATRQVYNGWVLSSPTKLVTPLSVRITNANKQVLTGNGVITSIVQNTVFDFGSNFGTSGGPQVTPKPTSIQTTLKPTNQPPSTSVHLQIRMHQGANPWWFAAYFEDSNGNDLDANSAKVRCPGETSWTFGKKSQWKYFSFGGRQSTYTFPISVVFEAAVNGVVQSFVLCGGLNSFTTGATFPVTMTGTDCPMMAASQISGTPQPHQNSGKQGEGKQQSKPRMNTAILVAVTVSAVACIVAVALCLFCRHKSQSKTWNKNENLLEREVKYTPPAPTAIKKTSCV